MIEIKVIEERFDYTIKQIFQYYDDFIDTIRFNQESRERIAETEKQLRIKLASGGKSQWKRHTHNLIVNFNAVMQEIREEWIELARYLKEEDSEIKRQLYDVKMSRARKQGAAKHSVFADEAVKLLQTAPPDIDPLVIKELQNIATSTFDGLVGIWRMDLENPFGR